MVPPEERDDDGALVERAKGGSQEAFGLLVRRHQDRAFAVAFRVVRQREDALDIAQEAFVRAYQSLAGFKGEAKFSTWLHRIVVNLALDHLRRQPHHEAGEYKDARALEEAAWLDGAGLGQGFLRIVLPLTAPGLAATAILCFLYAWNDFFFALILTRTEAMTAPVAVVNFMNYEGWEWGKIAAGGTLVMLPVLIFSFVFVFVNFIVDLLYGVLDPRIRYA